MLENISLIGGIYTRLGAGDWRGVVWNLPGLQFPGIGSRFMEVYASDNQARITPQEARRLALAVVTQAVRDAQTTDKSRQADREAARSWLRSEGVQFWLDLMGTRIDKPALARWVETGCNPNSL